MRDWRTEDLLWRPSPSIEIARYAIAGLVVATLGSAALALFRQNPYEHLATDADDAVLIDLPPAIESAAPRRDVQEGPEQQAMQTANPAAPSPAVVKPDPPVPLAHDAKPEQPPNDRMDIPPSSSPEAVVSPPKPSETPSPETPPETPPTDHEPDTANTKAPPSAPPVAAAPAQDETGRSGSATRVTHIEAIDSEEAHARARRAISRWQRSLLARLHAAKGGTHTGGESGSVEVGFSIGRSGSVEATHVIRGSGSPRLDRAALALVQRASPFPPPPAGLKGRDLSFTVPIIFAHRR